MFKRSGFSLFKSTVMTMLFLLSLIVTISGLAWSQTNPTDSKPQLFTADQLDQMTAPIALYPDELVAHILPASTVPLEVVQADRYVKDHGGKVTDMPDTDWDASVKALTMFPDVLSMMDKNLDWTETLGSAVINQQKDVMDSIQRLRKKNYDVGNLNNMDHQTVVVEKEVIKIVPSDPQVVYVPQYNPTTVVQAAPSPGGIGLAFATGIMVADWFNYRTTDWYNNRIIVNPVYIDHYHYPPNSRYYGYYHGPRGYPPGGGYWQPTPYSKEHYHNHVGNNTYIKFNNNTINIGNNVHHPDDHHPHHNNPPPNNKPHNGNKPPANNKSHNGNKPPAANKPHNGNNNKPQTAYKPHNTQANAHKPTQSHEYKKPASSFKMPEFKKTTGSNNSPFGSMESRNESRRHSERGSSSRSGGGSRRGGRRK